ncbi:HAMP domain-containing histidine kinase [Candidatus Daviesbacteria bacterium]|nr:HAMP domain-containing histidine kinase [Candidatus Daviesbacteria bacterium]
MKLFPNISFNTDVSQLIYAIFVIIAVPALLSFNTIYILNSIQRDTDFELNNKALLVESSIALQIRDKINNSARLQSELKELVEKLPEIRALEVFKISNDNLSPLVSTSEITKSVADPVLNNLAWSTEKAYSKQIIASVGSKGSERLWLVASPVHDSSGKKVALINLYLSAAQIDEISSRTTRDSFFILIITMVAILLLLINHFRFFEISILFKRLSDLDRLKDDFISMASHELQTPLTAIANYAYLLQRSPAIQADPKLSKHVLVIMESSSRLKTLVADVLDVSRIEQKRLKLNIVPTDIRTIIESLVAELMPQAQIKGLKMVYQKPNSQLIIASDAAKLHQIFYNLIGNAIKYTPSGEVVISHDVVKGFVRTYIKDSGIGISAQDREKLFGKFVRIYNEKTKDIYGTGLGLWITKQLVEMMGGKISVDSIENYGTQFAVTFPLKNSTTP